MATLGNFSLLGFGSNIIMDIVYTLKFNSYLNYLSLELFGNDILVDVLVFKVEN